MSIKGIDLFINYNVIRDSVLNGQDIKQIIKDILKKVSTAAGGIWDFDLVGADTAVANSTTILIVDRRYSGLTNTYDLQKDNQTWKFKSHTKNSIVILHELSFYRYIPITKTKKYHKFALKFDDYVINKFIKDFQSL